MMKFNVFVVGVIFLVFQSSCSNTKSQKLIENKHVSEVFTVSEIQSLEKIIHYFDDLIAEGISDELNIIHSYECYFENIRETEEIDDIYFKVGLKFSESARNLISELKRENVFERIWSYENISYSDTNDLFGRRLVYNINDKYTQLLERISNDNNFVNRYVNDYTTVGDISPVGMSLMIFDYDQIDFSNELYRLIIAIHYITICSEMEIEVE